MDNIPSQPTPSSTGSLSPVPAALGLGCFGMTFLVLMAVLMGGYFLMINKPVDNFFEDGSSFSSTDIGSVFSGYAVPDDFIDDSLVAYQVGAYAHTIEATTSWPGMQFTTSIDTPMQPLPQGDTGSLWVGGVLDNGYFLQIGLMTTDELDEEGNMEWSYFWEVWDEEDNYIYGIQESLVNYGWTASEDMLFSITCQDELTGTWEFAVNNTAVGSTETESCDMDYNNMYTLWEVTTHEYKEGPERELPEFGPFQFWGMNYWDGFEWRAVPSSIVAYAYGRVIDGTQLNPKAVCPPYGAESVNGKSVVRFGSGLGCLTEGSLLW